jgi:beta-barrel assembly-enhancing protease
MLLRWALLLLTISPLIAQATCEVIYPPIPLRGPTIFSPTQEAFLGDFFEEQARRATPVYVQPELTERMNQIVARLLTFLPATEYKFQLTLIELADANAFAIPGGRIFVSRRLIASVEDEDELAGILAHEMGHVLARQGSVDMTRYLREITKVTSVGDRADIFAKLHALMDAPGRRSKIKSGTPDDDQIEADRISSEATWRAGFDPAGLPRWIDRISSNKGATGNFISDLFGRTRPESKRYREMLKSIESIPASCRQGGAAAGESFVSWRKRLTDLAPEDLLTTNSTRVPAVKLLPVLRPDLSNIRFSPDGHSLLAQDQSGITILDSEPLRVRMRILALGAEPALFHKDSTRVLFRGGTGRVEIWNVQTQLRERRIDLPENARCQSVLLAPDAKTFACVTGLGSTVSLYDLMSGEKLAQHQAITNTLALLEGILSGRPVGAGQFSPDGSVFLYGSRAPADNPWAFGVSERKEISIRGPLRGAMNDRFAFLENGRLAVVATKVAESGIFSFPEGTQLSKFTIPSTGIYSVAKGDTLVLRPMGIYAAGLVNLKDQQIFQASTKSAMDRYDDLGASERNTGELALYRGKSAQAVASINLPEGWLTGLRSGVHSADLSWIAMSTATRGQIWNLRAGGSALTAPFDGGTIEGNGIWTASFEQRDQKPGSSTFTMERYRIATDLGAGKEISNVHVARAEGVRSLFNGRYEVQLSQGEDKKKGKVEVREVAADKVLWARTFESTPRVYLGNALVVQIDPASKDGRDLVKKLKEQGATNPKDGELLDVLDLETGMSRGQLSIEVGGAIRRANLVGNTLYLEDTNNRTLAYELSTGERTGEEFGRILATDTAHGRIAMSNKLGSVSVLDKELRALAEFEYPRNVIYAGFDGDGKRLLVVTGAQEVFIERLPE